MTDKRVLKVEKGYHHYQTEQRTHTNTPIAKIRLDAKWLKGLGFDVGMKVSVDVSEKKIVINLLEKIG